MSNQLVIPAQYKLAYAAAAACGPMLNAVHAFYKEPRVHSKADLKRKAKQEASRKYRAKKKSANLTPIKSGM